MLTLVIGLLTWSGKGQEARQPVTPATSPHRWHQGPRTESSPFLERREMQAALLPREGELMETYVQTGRLLCRQGDPGAGRREGTDVEHASVSQTAWLELFKSPCRSSCSLCARGSPWLHVTECNPFSQINPFWWKKKVHASDSQLLFGTLGTGWC